METDVPGGITQSWKFIALTGSIRGRRTDGPYERRSDSLMTAVRKGSFSNWLNIEFKDSPSRLTVESSDRILDRMLEFERMWKDPTVSVQATVWLAAPTRVIPSSVRRVVVFSLGGRSLSKRVWKMVVEFVDMDLLPWFRTFSIRPERI